MTTRHGSTMTRALARRFFAAGAFLALGATALYAQADAEQASNLPSYKIVLVGDSTVATEGGWGPGFCKRMAPEVTCVDTAKNGTSTKSFIAEGLWDRALAEHGNLYLIQFGHNDQKPKPSVHADPDGLYTQNMEKFIREVRANGGDVVLVSPLARRTFHDGKPWNDDLRLYANAEQRIAAQEHLGFLDLLTLSDNLLATMTQEGADRFDANNHPDQVAENSGKADPKLDRTHLNWYGQQTFGSIVADALVRLKPKLAGYVEPVQE